MPDLFNDDNLTDILGRFEQNGFSAFVVGGAVRDALLGREVNDYDIASSALPEQVKTLFSDCTVVDTGIMHGTVTVVFKGVAYEVTTFRSEGGYSDSRHPDSVAFSKSVLTDLARRDFTINAIAYSQKAGLVDPYSGREDCKNGVIRAVGDARTRFSEDALRILRALRFSSTLGFTIEKGTADAIFELADKIKFVSRERVYAELRGIVTGGNALEVIEDYRPVVEKIAPAESDISALDRLPCEAAMRFACLFGKNAVAALRSLHADKATSTLVSYLADSEPIPDTVTGVKRFVSRYGRELSVKIAQYRRATYSEDEDRLTESVAGSDDCLSISELAVNGVDLINLGITGRSVGNALGYLLDNVVEGALENERETLIEAAKKYVDITRE